MNTTVKEFLITTDQDIKHLMAQKDIPFFNSKIEAFNKIIKHQFLLRQHLENRERIDLALANDVVTYNTLRPQLSLLGNAPAETFTGKTIDLKSYKTHFEAQKNIESCAKPTK